MKVKTSNKKLVRKMADEGLLKIKILRLMNNVSL